MNDGFRKGVGYSCRSKSACGKQAAGKIKGLQRGKQKDKEVVLVAAKNDSSALEFADTFWKTDKVY